MEGFGALEFLRESIGLELGEVFDRWKDTPFTFVPSHVSDKHGLTEAGSLFDLLRQALRAFVFGCDGAAMALCRAIMELVLTKHWGAKGKDLDNIIAFAEAKHGHHVERHRLHEKRILTNRVLHDSGTVTGKEVLSFLETLRTLIETAPSGGGGKPRAA